MTSKQRLILYGILLALVVLPRLAFADIPENNALDEAFGVFKDTASTWYDVLSGYAFNLLSMLMVIDLAWTLMMQALQGGGIQDFTAEIVRRIFFYGFFILAIEKSWEWSSILINSFVDAANAALNAASGVTRVSGSSLFDLGLDVAKKIVSEVSVFDPSAALGLLLAALVALVVMAIVAAMVLAAYIESYIVLGAGVLLLGFGGSRWTSDFAKKYLFYAFSVGVKLFVLNLIVGLSFTLIQTWANEFDSNSQTQVFVILGTMVVLLYLAKAIPDMLQGLMTGTSAGGSGAGAATVGALAGGAMAAAGGAAAVGASSKLAAAQGGGGGAMGHLGRMGANLGKAMKTDLGQKVGGEAPFGSVGGRMASNMNAQRTQMGGGGGAPSGGSLSGMGSPRPGMSGGFRGGSGGSSSTPSTSQANDAAGDSQGGEDESYDSPLNGR